MGCLQDVVVRSNFAEPNKPSWIIPRGWRHIIAVASAVVLGLGLIDSAYAAEISCTQDSYLLTTQADVDQLSTCVNATGSIVFENPILTRIAFNGLQKVDGSLAIRASPALIEISAPDLYWINHNFTLADLPLLSNLSLPSLGTVVDGLNWTALPSLVRPILRSQKADPFGNTGTQVYGDITVSKTGIQTLDFFQFVTLLKADNIRISDNGQMNMVNFSQLEKSFSLSFRNNGPSTQVVLPTLTDVTGDLEMSRVASVDVRKLARMDGGLDLNGNSFRNFSAPALTKLGGDVQVLNNPSLEALNLPLLQGIGGGLENGVFAIFNNSVLSSLDLPKLAGVDGNVTLNGGFSSISLPLLNDFSAGFHINTTSPSFNCSPFDTIFYASDSSKYPNLYSCYAIARGSTDDTAIHNVPSKGDGSLLPKGALAILSIVAAVAALLLIGLVIRYFRRRRAARRPPPVPPVELRELGVGQLEDGDGIDGLPQYSRIGKPGEVPPAYKQRRSGSNPETMLQDQIPRAVVPGGQTPPVSEAQGRVDGVLVRFKRWLVGGKVDGHSRGIVPVG